MRSSGCLGKIVLENLGSLEEVMIAEGDALFRCADILWQS